MIQGLSLRSTLRLALFGLSLAVIGGCGETRSELDQLETTSQELASTLRWGDPLRLAEFIDPSLREQLSPRGLAAERWRQVRVAVFRAEPPTLISPSQAQQSVSFELINQNTQAVRELSSALTWRYDEQAKRWWLTSGLPELAPR